MNLVRTSMELEHIKEHKSIRLKNAKTEMKIPWRDSTAKTEDSLNNLQEKLKHTDIHIIGVPEGEEREYGAKNIFKEIMAKKFPNPAKEIDNQVQEAQRFPNKTNPKRPTP